MALGISKRPSSGFSLIELTVAILITALIAAVTIYSIFMGSTQRSLVSEQMSLQQSSATLVEMMRNDLAKAVRVTSATGAGTADLPSGVSVSSTANGPMLTIYQEAFSDIAQRIDSLAGNANFQGTINTAENNGKFFQGALDTYDYFFVSNSTNSYIVKNEKGSSSASGGVFKLNTLTISKASIDTTALSREITSATTWVRALNVVTYAPNSSGQLIRTENPGAKTVAVSRLASVSNPFQLSFTYTNGMTPQQNLYVRLGSVCKSVREFSTADLNSMSPCTPTDTTLRVPKWSDLAAVSMDISTRGEKSLGKVDIGAANNSGGFSQDSSGFLNLKKNESINVATYAKSSSASQLTDLSCVPLSKNRCKESCSGYFNNTTWAANTWPPPDDWEGYGRYSGINAKDPTKVTSDYCQCGTNSNGDFFQPEIDWSKITVAATVGSPLSSMSSRDVAQLDACGKFYGCNSFEFKQKHAAYGLACDAMQPNSPVTNPLFISQQFDAVTQSPNAYILKNPFPGATPGVSGSAAMLEAWGDFSPSTGRTAAWYKFDTSSTPAAGTADGTNKARYLNCAAGQLYGPAHLQRMNGVGVSSNLSNLTDPWKAKCGCLSYNMDENGKLSGLIMNAYADFRMLCNVDINTKARQTSSLYCPNTWDSSATAYKITGADFTDGLTPDRAALCQCLFDHPPTSDWSSDPSDKNSAFSRRWDFRTSTAVAGNPSTALPSSGSHLAFLVNYGVVTSSNQSPGLRYYSCDVAQMFNDDHGAPSIAACTAPYFDPNNADYTRLPNYSRASKLGDGKFTPVAGVQSAYRATHSGYCWSTCSENSSNLSSVRNAISTLVNGNLPPDCGGANQSKL
ncbi:MAG: type II secretion system protein [Deltaproteobacteria bacterium]|nr:type II secretion system protein [Deltaproteobacteria bacterium]